MSPREKAFRTLVWFVAIIGALSFIGDVLSPATPTPLVWPRVVVFALLVFAMIRLLVPLALLLVLTAVRSLSGRDSNHEYGGRRVLDMTCVQLR